MIKIAIVSNDTEYLDMLKRKEQLDDFEYDYLTDVNELFNSKEKYGLVLVDDAIRDLTFDETTKLNTYPVKMIKESDTDDELYKDTIWAISKAQYQG